MVDAAFRRLEILLGAWRMEAVAGGRTMAVAHTRFAWIEDGAFLRQHTRSDPSEEPGSGWGERSPLPVTGIIGLDDTAGAFTMLYADGRGVRRVYRFNVAGGVWSMSRAAPGFHQRFTATFGDDGRTVRGAWEGSADGTAWSKDFDVVYTRVD